jgi:hypothetical protein
MILCDGVSYKKQDVAFGSVESKKSKSGATTKVGGIFPLVILNGHGYLNQLIASVFEFETSF